MKNTSIGCYYHKSLIFQFFSLCVSFQTVLIEWSKLFKCFFQSFSRLHFDFHDVFFFFVFVFFSFWIWFLDVLFFPTESMTSKFVHLFDIIFPFSFHFAGTHFLMAIFICFDFRFNWKLQKIVTCNAICNRNKSRFDAFEYRCFE